MSSPYVINAIQPPWGLICTTLSHKSGTLRACQQLIDIQEQFPCPQSLVKDVFIFIELLNELNKAPQQEATQTLILLEQ